MLLISGRVILWSTEYRDPLIHQIIQRRSLLGRKIDAAVAASGLIKRSAKLASPRCVMKADPAVKRHPVIYMALILIGSVRLFLSSEYPILFLIGQAVDCLLYTSPSPRDA